MSAPNTNPDKQASQHRGPLTGMAMAVLFAAVLLVGFILYVTMRGGSPEGAAAQVDGRTGATEETATGAGGDGVSANDDASDDEPAAQADDAAVTVAPETVTAPDSGAGNPADTDPGESQAAEPLE